MRRRVRLGASERNESLTPRRPDRDRAQGQGQRQAARPRGAGDRSLRTRRCGGGAMKLELRFGKALRALALVGFVTVAVATPVSPAGAAPSAPRVDDGAVRKALEDEMARTLTQLKLGSEAPPY